MTEIDDMTIVALNDAESSENRIHSDDIANKYGFSGALVSGANVFGYLTQPLTRHFGESCLQRAEFDVRFRSPAYHKQRLVIKTSAQAEKAGKQRLSSNAFNDRGELLAELETVLGRDAPTVSAPYPAAPEPSARQRQIIHWDEIRLFEAAADFLWTPTEQENTQRVQAQRDDGPMYRGAAAHIHPYYLLDACNKALMRLFILPAWIHTGSRVLVRHAIRLGQAIVVRAVPTAKWERKGHQFIKLDIVMIVDDEVALQVEHTAIFRIAE